MERQRIREISEAFFQKYKKTEGDATVWSAPYVFYGPSGTFEINFTQCPKGDVFKIFTNGSKLTEIIGWDVFLEALPGYERDYPGLFSIDGFFTELEAMV